MELFGNHFPTVCPFPGRIMPLYAPQGGGGAKVHKTEAISLGKELLFLSVLL
jgi:hypothetical protein